MIKPRKLFVFPNPWGVAPRSVTIDQLGTPCGHYPTDPHQDVGRKWVGARLDRKRTKKLQILKKLDNARSARQRTVFEFCGISGHEITAKALAEKKPIALPYTQHYRRGIKTGELVAADQATADACGVKFEKPGDLLARREKEAISRFNMIVDNANGFELLQKRRNEEEAEADKEAAEASKDKAPAKDSKKATKKSTGDGKA